MITSDIGWYNFNQLMNDLREAIATYGKKILPIGVTHYYFRGFDNFSLSGENDSSIVGICRENTDINIIVRDREGLQNEFDLTYAGFHPDDFLHLLKTLENATVL